MANLQDHRKNNKRPQKTTPEQNQEIIRAVDENPFASVINILRNRDINICAQTIRRRLRAAKVHCKPAAKKIELKPRHREQRMLFANPKYVLPSRTSGRITLGIWRCMTSHGLVELTEISPRMDAEEYVEILEEILKPAIRRIFPEDQYSIVKIAQDNSTVHISRLMQACDSLKIQTFNKLDGQQSLQT